MYTPKITFIVLLMVFFIPWQFSRAETDTVRSAALELALIKESFFAPNLEINITIKPGGQAINAFDTIVIYDPADLEAISVEPNPGLGLLAAASSINNRLGQAEITCGTTTPLNFNTIIAAKITFKKLAVGFTEITFSNNSQVAAANGLGSNILLSSEVHNIYLAK